MELAYAVSLGQVGLECSHRLLHRISHVGIGPFTVFEEGSYEK